MYTAEQAAGSLTQHKKSKSKVIEGKDWRLSERTRLRFQNKNSRSIQQLGTLREIYTEFALPQKTIIKLDN